VIRVESRHDLRTEDRLSACSNDLDMVNRVEISLYHFERDHSSILGDSMRGWFNLPTVGGTFASAAVWLAATAEVTVPAPR
jgi:hypothetical protein